MILLVFGTLFGSEMKNSVKDPIPRRACLGLEGNRCRFAVQSLLKAPKLSWLRCGDIGSGLPFRSLAKQSGGFTKVRGGLASDT